MKKTTQPPSGAPAPDGDRKQLTLQQIRTDGGTQPRCRLDDDVVAEYAEAYQGKEAKKIHDIEVVFDGESYWLFDGFHRHAAATLAKLRKLWCIVHQGTLDDARWMALSTNKTHGLRRSNADKRRAVELALKQRPELSDGAIAEHVGVTQPFVSKVRGELASTNNGYESTTRVGLDGRTIDVSNIGKRPDTTDPDARKAQEPPSGTTLPPSTRPLPAPEADANAPDPPADEEDGWHEPVSEWEAADADADRDEPPAPTPAVSQPQAGPLDAWGIPVQPHAAEAFALAHRFDELARKLRDCAKDLSALVDTPAGKHLLKQVQWVRSQSKAGGRWVLAYLDNAIRTVEMAKPHVTDCPYAFNDEGQHPEKCNLCHNTRWLASPNGHQIPPGLTKAMKAHYGVAVGTEEEVA